MYLIHICVIIQARVFVANRTAEGGGGGGALLRCGGRGGGGRRFGGRRFGGAFGRLRLLLLSSGFASLFLLFVLLRKEE
jgi:hypothetical protein